MVLATTWGNGARAGALDGALADPGAAERFDYCAWAAGSDLEVPDLSGLLQGGGEPEQHAAAALVDAGTQIAQSDPKGCAKALAKGSKSVQRSYAKAYKALARKPSLSDDPELAAVQQQVTDLWVADQAVRQVYVQTRGFDQTGWQLWARRLAFVRATIQDERSTDTLRELIDRYGWVDANRFGGPVSQHVWLLAQHADDHPDLQARALEQMALHLDDGGVRKRDYAYLFDRVAVNHDRPQRYGTQPLWTCQEDGSLPLAPLEDPEQVDVRRAEMGLGPVAADLADMARHFCAGQ